ncbi:MAG: DegT/DnrJ/EryC1/StrS family aminotransferase [Candidatus Acidiferrales bacterium]
MKTVTAVPYYDLKEQYAALRSEILEALDRTCRNAAFSLGDEVASFEKEFASYCEAKHCIALNSGTSALHLALLAAGIGPGDEVITTPNTFIATAEAIAYTGAKIVFADIDPLTANLDPRLAEAVVTPRTKAILPVHLYGRPADMDAFQKLADAHKLALIEDAAQAHGARFRGRRVGALGASAAFSFYPSKNLGAYGEAGALVTNDDRVAEYCRAARSHGEIRRYFHDFIGYNYRMEGFQGAVLRVKLRHLDDWSARRKAIAQRYREKLSGLALAFPQDDSRDECAYHLFVIYVENRDSVQAELKNCGIGTAVHYPLPLHLQKALAHLGYKPGDFPHAERACRQALALPIFPELTTEQVDYVCESLREIIGHT